MTISCRPVFTLLSADDQAQLRRGARAAHRVEQRYSQRFDQIFDRLEQEAIRALETGAMEPPDLDVTMVLLENVHDSIKAALETQPRLPTSLAKGTPKAGPAPKIKIPTNPRELREWWDRVRKGKAPARIQALAGRIKQAYLHTAQRLWVEYAEDFREGRAWSQELVRAQMKRAVAVGRHRARIIVATETTRYYNQARTGYYDQQDTVTHYLYVAVRDHRTTKWCKPGIGRDGIVYTKGTEVLERETPPTHYQCRSELLPLSPFNPNHRKLIEDQSRRRENRRPAPLLPGWNR